MNGHSTWADIRAGRVLRSLTTDDSDTPKGSGGASSDLISVLRTRAPRLALAVAAGQAAMPGVRAIQARYKEHTTYTVKVQQTGNELYDDTCEWVLSQMPPPVQRALLASVSHRRRWEDDILPPSQRGLKRLRLHYDGTRSQTVTIGGHRVRVSVTDPVTHSRDPQASVVPEVVFTCRSVDARDAVLTALQGLLNRDRNIPAFRMLNKYGDWQRMDDLPPRTPDSVILPAGQMETLITDVERFLAAEPDYARRHLPWHRGYLFDGPPGTGKTSVARAVAHTLGMDVWYLPLADIDKDISLISAVSQVNPRSMLLIEDADVFHAATQRDDYDGGATLSGLLNSLDGIATPHGLITVLTSNEPGLLDAALVRPGRIDRVEHFGLAGPDEVRRLIARYYDTAVAAVAAVPAVPPIAPAAVIEVCKRHDTAGDALAELCGMLAEGVTL